eukprot:COSAG04_NODE_2217_length_4511_cov_12.523345_2_plen_269_part_00
MVAGTTGNAAATAEASPSLELERGERGGGESGDRESFELVLDESPDAAAATQIAGGGSEAPPSEDGEGGAGAGTQLQPMGPTGRRRRTLSSDEEDDVEDEDQAEEEEQAASASEAESEEQEEVRAEGAQGEGAAAAAAPGYSAGAQRLGGGPCASEEELRQRRLQALEPSDATAEEPEGPEAPATEPQHEPASSTDAGAAGAAAAPTAAPSVCEWLRSAGLGEHVAAFEAEKIDMLSLGMLSEADLTALGLPLGHRRRFQAYVEAGFG